MSSGFDKPISCKLYLKENFKKKERTSLFSFIENRPLSAFSFRLQGNVITHISLVEFKDDSLQVPHNGVSILVSRMLRFS